MRYQISDPFLAPGMSLSRLFDDYKKHKNLIVAFDFDNTVFDYHKQGFKYDKVVSILKRCQQLAFTLICFTSCDDVHFVRRTLIGLGIKALINENAPETNFSESRKIYYNILLDDRAGLSQAYNDLLNITNIIIEHNAAARKI